MKLFEFGPVVQEMLFKSFLSGALAVPLFSGSEPIQLRRGHHGEHSCEIICNWDQWFLNTCHLKKKLMDNSRKTDIDRSHELTLSLRLRSAKM